jgi:hypothetical protein
VCGACQLSDLKVTGSNFPSSRGAGAQGGGGRRDADDDRVIALDRVLVWSSQPIIKGAGREGGPAVIFYSNSRRRS